MQTLLAEYHDSSGGEEEAADEDGEQGGDEGMAALVAAEGDPPMPDMMALGEPNWSADLGCSFCVILETVSGVNACWNVLVLPRSVHAPNNKVHVP